MSLKLLKNSQILLNTCVLFSSLSYAQFDLSSNELLQQDDVQHFDFEHSSFLDKVVVNPNANENMYFFKKQNGRDKLVLSTINFSEDGGNQFSKILPRVNLSNVIRIVTTFPDRGHFVIFYDIAYENNDWFISQISYESRHWQTSPDTMTYCYKETRINLNELNQENWFDRVRPFSKNWDNSEIQCEENKVIQTFENIYDISTKKYLFNQPQFDAKTKMYLIKGDKVELIQRQGDFYQIDYQSAKKGMLRKWIHCSAIEAC